MSLPSGENLRDWQCYLGSEMYYARRFTVPHSSPQQTFFVFFPTKTRLLFVTTFSMSSRRCGGFTWRQCDEPDPSPTQAPEGESQPEKEETEEKKETPEVAPLSLSSNISCWELLWASISRSFVVTIIHFSCVLVLNYSIPTSRCPWPLGITHHLVFACHTSLIADVCRCHGNLYLPPIPRCLRRPLTQLVVCWVLMAARVRWTGGRGHVSWSCCQEIDFLWFYTQVYSGLQKASQQYAKSYKDS